MALTCQVRETFPVAVLSLSGELTAHDLGDAEQIILDSLATMPAALVLDAAELTFAADDGLDRLGELAESSAKWPGVPVVLVGPEFDVTPCRRYLICVPTVAAAREALAGVVVSAREHIGLPPEPSSCGRAREFVAAACAKWGVRRSARLAELVVSELVANGVMHAKTPLAVTVRRQDSGIEISVRDDNPVMPSDSSGDPRGFGLQLVGALSEDWGIARTGRGKVVWTKLTGVGSKEGAPEGGRLSQLT